MYLLMPFFSNAVGEVRQPFYLATDSYVPDRLTNKINRITSSIMENGLYHYYEKKQKDLVTKWSYTLKVLTGNNEDEDYDKLVPMSLEQMKRVMLFILCTYGFATIIFFAEIFIFWWNKRLNRK